MKLVAPPQLIEGVRARASGGCRACARARVLVAVSRGQERALCMKLSVPNGWRTREGPLLVHFTLYDDACKTNGKHLNQYGSHCAPERLCEDFIWKKSQRDFRQG